MKTFTTDKGSKNMRRKLLLLVTLLKKKMLKHTSGITAALPRASFSAVTRINKS